ncbi:MAG: RHS repeat-associated core domain-containing protein [Erysipelotrichaceae bacterium]|jgi:RHS repeat-associated protein|nr:RHS repeat-associated core domain-containing protein [Erysipelotrichaceae bacterium]
MYNNSEYFYQRNIQGDIIAIYDTTGSLKAKYTYDAYGNHIITNYDVSELGDLNPFRYRGYYYDVETNLYYLQSRYYDPKIGRFISKDHLNYLDPKTIGGLNLYAYCGGNPVMRVDPSGNAWYDVLAWIGIGLVVAAAIVLTAGAAGFVIGGVAGGIIYGAAVGSIVLGVTGAVGGAVGGMIYDAVQGNDFGTNIWTGVKIGFGIGAIAGAVIGGAIGGAAASSVTGMSNLSFWSKLGSDGASVAAKAAAEKGMTTIGQAFGGKVVSAVSKIFPRAVSRILWASLSKTAAHTLLMSSVFFFYGSPALSETIWFYMNTQNL